MTNLSDNRLGLLWYTALIALLAHMATAGEPIDNKERSLSFEADVRPILRRHCFQCHGEHGHAESALDVRLRRFIVKGGDSGAAIEPGAPDRSLLWTRMHDGSMPPEDVALRPSAREIAIVGRWIATGARTSGPEPAQLTDGYYTEQERNYWAFRPVLRPRLPSVQHGARVQSPVDRFLLSRLEQEDLHYAPPADRRQLIRRLTFDLWGLPPAPAEVKRFVDDTRPDAYERLVGRLLASPKYGERWAQHWLDVAGYADSEGATNDDVERPHAFRYRDYVIGAHNGDKPWDQFVREQLAGDEMVAPPYAELPVEQLEKVVATGFLRMAPDGTGSGGIDQTAARNQTIADTLEIVGASLLGLTVQCAQCHDHRYDPIAQTDYYRLRAVFAGGLDWKNWRTPQQRRVSLYTAADRAASAQIEEQVKNITAEKKARQTEYIEATFQRELAKLPAETRDAVAAARNTPAKSRTAAQEQLLKEYPSVNVTAGSLYLYDRKAADKLKEFDKQISDLRATKPVERFVRALTEPASGQPTKTHRFHRGDPQQPREETPPGGLRVLSGAHGADIANNDAQLPTSGRRSAFAKQLTDGQHPLTARVLVNRVWLNHFGTGLVATPSDFGTLGDRPSHPQLLDWLASEFVSSGWSLKRLHRLIVTSAAYRQSSINAKSAEVDPDNRLLGRWPLRRLDAESFRDALLSLSGRLIRRQYGPSVPVMADRLGRFVPGKENLNAGRPGAVLPLHGEQFRRSIYVQVRRSRTLDLLSPFDAPAKTPNCTHRSSSTVSTQSLLMMNGPFVLDRCLDLAQAIAKRHNDPAEQARAAWVRILGRAPNSAETAEAVQFLDEQARTFADRPRKKSDATRYSTTGDEELGSPPVSPAEEALAGLCQALVSSNAFLYVE